MRRTPRSGDKPDGPITMEQARALSRSVAPIPRRIPTDAALQAQVDADPDLAPLQTTDQLNAAVLVPGPTRTLVSLCVDNDVLESYRATGKGWQTRMHAVLAASVRAPADPVAAIELHLEHVRLAVQRMGRR